MTGRAWVTEATINFDQELDPRDHFRPPGLPEALRQERISIHLSITGDPEIMRELWRKLHEVMHAQGVQSDFPALEAERGEK